MNIIFSPYTILMIVAVICCISIVIYVWPNRRKNNESVPLILLLIGIIEWVIAALLGLLDQNLAHKIIWAKIEYIGVVSVPLMVLIFVLYHSGSVQRIAVKWLIYLGLIPLLTLVAAWTNEAHGLVWASYIPGYSDGMVISQKTYGLVFWIYWAYSYLILLAALVIAFRSIFLSAKIFKWQNAAIILGTLAPWIGNLLSVLKINPFNDLDLTPLAFSVTGLSLALGVLQWRLFGIKPIAREAVISGMADGLIVLDVQNYIVNVNPAGQRILGRIESELIGKKMEEVVPEWSQSGTLNSKSKGKTIEIKLETNSGIKDFDLSTSLFYDKIGSLGGRIVLLHETTEQKLLESNLRKVELEHERYLLSQVENRYETLYKNMSVGVIYLDKTGRLIDMNPAARKMFTASNGKMVNPFLPYDQPKTIHEDGTEFPPDEYPTAVSLKSGKPLHDQLMGIHLPAENQYRWINVNTEPLFMTGEKKPYQVFVTFIDVTDLKQSNENLQNYKLLQKAVFNSTDDFIWTVDPEHFGLVTFNKALEDYFAIQRRRKIKTGDRPEDLFDNAEFVKIWREIYNRVIKEKNLRIEYGTFSGGFILELRASVLEQKNEVIGISVFGRNVTKEKQSEKALLETRNYWQSLVENTTDVITVLDEDAKILYQNPAVERILGYNPVELVGESASKIIHPDDWHSNWETFVSYIKSQTLPPPLIEMQVQKKNGEWVIMETTGETLHNENGQEVSVLTSRDITERKRAEETIRESERKYKSIFENSIDGIFQTTPEGKYISLNPAIARILGYDTQEEMMTGTKHLVTNTYANPEDRKELVSLLTRDGELNNHEVQMVKKDGSYVWVSMNVHAVRNDDGKLIYFEGTLTDISDRKLAEKEIEKSENRFRTVFMTGADAYLIAERDTGRMLEVNERMVELYGYSHEEFVGHTSLDLGMWVHPDARQQMLKQLKTNGKIRNLEVLARRKNGETFWVLYSVDELDIEGTPLILGVIRDDTHRRRVEEALKQSEEKFRLAFMTGLDAYYWATLKDGRILEINPEFEKLFGYSREEVIGKTSLELGLYFDPEDRTRMVTAIKEKGFVKDLELKGRRKDGLLITVSMSVSVTQINKENYILGVIRDITQENQSKTNLIQSEEKFRQLTEKSIYGIYIIQNGKMAYVNPSLAKIFGYSQEEIMGKLSPADLIHPDDIQTVMSKLRERLNGAVEKGEIVYKGVRKDGSIIKIEVFGMAINHLGEPAVMGTLLDVTESLRAQESLRESENLFRTSFESSIAGISMVQADGKFIKVNNKFCEILGYDQTELLNLTFNDITYREDKNIGTTVLKQMITGECDSVSFEKRYVRKDGDVIWAYLSASAIRDKLNHLLYIVTYTQDITEQKTIVERIALREERYRSLVDTQNSLIARSDISGKLTFVNDAYCHAFGKSREELLGNTYVSTIIPEDREISNKAHESLSKPPYRYYIETHHQTPNGIRLFSWEGSVVFDEKKHIIEVQGVGNDITERKQTQIDLQNSIIKLRKTVEGTIETLALVVEARDPYTSGHQKRVAEISVSIAEKLKLPENQKRGIYYASLIHDLGKIQVPAEILSKPGKLTKLEFEMIKIHPQIGYELLKGIEFPWPIAEIIQQHHERLDGSGYPLGLKGDKTLIEAKIIGVADVIEAMSSHRPYRPALGMDAAVSEIKKNRGILFDPVVVNAFLKVWKEEKGSGK